MFLSYRGVEQDLVNCNRTMKCLVVSTCGSLEPISNESSENNHDQAAANAHRWKNTFYMEGRWEEKISIVGCGRDDLYLHIIFMLILTICFI
jgi:hypothetical protein